MRDNIKGKLYLVSTPIGNLGDISARAIEVLSTVNLIACEDTRHTQKLLNHFNIRVRTISYHEHNERGRSVELIQRIASGESIALVSDAGTPGINDPGSDIVSGAIEAGIDVIPVPGAVAFISALIASGLPTDAIFFGGFLPSKKGERRKQLIKLRQIPATLIFYESPHRIESSLADCLEILGDRAAAIARELTKLHEEFIRGSLSFLRSSFLSAKPRGEYVLIIDRERESEPSKIDKSKVTLSERVAELEKGGTDRRTAMKTAAKEFGLNRSEAYRRLLQDE